MSATTKRSFLLTDANDLDISAATLQFAAGLQAMKQAVRSSILLFLGEWFLNTAQGTAWKQVIFVKNPNMGLVRSELRTAILRVEGVSSLDALDVTFDRATRTVTAAFAATCDFGVFDDVVTAGGA